MSVPEICVLDTNFLIEALSRKVDIVHELRGVLPGYKIAVLAGTQRELLGIQMRDKTQTSLFAKIAIKWIKEKEWLVIEHTDLEYVDAALIDLASRKKIKAVATLDLALRRKLRETGVGLVVLRQRKYLELA